MIPEKPTITSAYLNRSIKKQRYITLPLENGYSIIIHINTDDDQTILFDTRGRSVYTQPWRTDAIRNCMDAMVRNECVTQSKGDRA